MTKKEIIELLVNDNDKKKINKYMERVYMERVIELNYILKKIGVEW